MSSVLLCVKRYRHLVAKNELAFSFRPTWKDHKCACTMLMLHVDLNIKRLGIRFKNDSFQWFRVDSFFWETISLYTVHFQIYNFTEYFNSLRAVLHCMKCYFQKSGHFNNNSTLWQSLSQASCSFKSLIHFSELPDKVSKVTVIKREANKLLISWTPGHDGFSPLSTCYITVKSTKEWTLLVQGHCIDEASQEHSVQFRILMFGTQSFQLKFSLLKK